MVQDPVLQTILPTECLNLTLISLWGFDGATGQSSYNQKKNNLELDDQSVLMALLQLFGHSDDSQDRLAFLSSKKLIKQWLA